jgi:hypothetical protein
MHPAPGLKYICPGIDHTAVAIEKRCALPHFYIAGNDGQTRAVVYCLKYKAARIIENMYAFCCIGRSRPTRLCKHYLAGKQQDGN